MPKAPALCSVKQCEQYADKKGLCAMHFHKRGEELDEDDLVDAPPQYEGGGEGEFKLAGKVSKDLSGKMAKVLSTKGKPKDKEVCFAQNEIPKPLLLSIFII